MGNSLGKREDSLSQSWCLVALKKCWAALMRVVACSQVCVACGDLHCHCSGTSKSYFVK